MPCRSSIHTSGGYTPFSLMFGRKMPLPLDVMVVSLAGEPNTNYSDIVRELKVGVYTACRDTRVQLQASHQRHFNKNVGTSTCSAGNLIFNYLQLRVGEKATFLRDWNHLVVDWVTEVTIYSQTAGSTRPLAKTVHLNSLKLYQRATAEPQDSISISIYQSLVARSLTPDTVISSDKQDAWMFAPSFESSTGTPVGSVPRA